MSSYGQLYFRVELPQTLCGEMLLVAPAGGGVAYY